MTQTSFPIFKIDGEEYVADVRSVLMSNPPKYNCYRLKDKKHDYVYIDQVSFGKKVMYESDFLHFIWGKDTTPVVSLLPPSLEERFEDLCKRVEALEKLTGEK